MIKAIIKKELRENLKVAVPGLLAVVILLVYTCRTYNVALAGLAQGLNNNVGVTNVQPLISKGFLLQMGWLIALLGVGLGFMQIRSESNRDLWAFLVHRPISRSKIFFGKVIAGLMLYLAAVGVPLGAFVIWNMTPGHVAAPFEWGNVVPAAVLWISGMAFYFAGMLTGVRQARWYVSRALGLGLPVLSALSVVNIFEFVQPQPYFWLWLAGAAACLAVLAVAAWGSFTTGGAFEKQPTAGKGALIFSLMVGGALVMGLTGSLVTTLFARPVSTQDNQSYTMGKDGTIYRQVMHLTLISGPARSYSSSQRTEFYDLDGKLVTSETDGKPLDRTEMYQHQASGFTAEVNIHGEYPRRYFSSESTPFVDLLTASADSIWFVWRKTGRLVGYDIRTRLPIGSVGPEGFAGDPVGNGQGFRESLSYRNFGAWQLLHTDTSAYLVDLNHRTFTTNFTTTADDPIGAAVSSDFNNILVVTRKYIHALAADGREQFKTPYDPGYPNYRMVTLWSLLPPGRFSVWFIPTVYGPAAPRLREHAIWLAEDGTVTKAMDLPDLPLQPYQGPTAMETLLDRLSTCLAPLPIMSIRVLAKSQRGPAAWRDFFLSLTGTVVTVIAGWRLGRRHRHTRGAQFGWAIYHLLFNVVGLLTFVFVQEWPAREECPECKQQRVVDHDHCDECGAPFPPAEKNGTEIFEPLETEMVPKG